MGPQTKQQDAKLPNDDLRDRLEAAKGLGLVGGREWVHVERGDHVRIVTAALDDKHKPVVVFTWDGIAFVRGAGHFMARFKQLPNGNSETPKDDPATNSGDVQQSSQAQTLLWPGYGEIPVVCTRWRRVDGAIQWYVAHAGHEDVRKEVQGRWFDTQMFKQG
jgi:hypothetical protein